MRPRREREETVRETRAEDDLELQALRLVNRHHLDRVEAAARRVGVVGRRRQQALERSGDVGQQRLGAMQPLVHDLDRLEPFDRRPQVAERLRPVVGCEIEVEQLPGRPVLDEDRVRQARERQPPRALLQALPSEHGAVYPFELVLGEEGHEVGFGPSFTWRRPAFRQGIPLRIAVRERVHDAVDDALQRSCPLRRVRAEPADRPRADPAQARCQRALEGVVIVGVSQRLEVSDEEADDLVARGRAPTAHLVRDSERAQRLFEGSTKRGRASQHDREVGEMPPRPL